MIFPANLDLEWIIMDFPLCSYDFPTILGILENHISRFPQENDNIFPIL